MKKIISALLSIVILLGMLVIPTGAGAYEFSGNEPLFVSDFYEKYQDYRWAIYEAMDCIYILPFKGTKGFGATYKDDEIQLMDGFEQLVLPTFNSFGLSPDSAEYKEAMRRSGASDSLLRLVYDRSTLEQAVNIKFGQDKIDMANLYDDPYTVSYIDDDYIVTWQSARGETSPGNGPYIDKAYELNDETMYCEWHVENSYDHSISECIYTILTRNYFNGILIISYDYLSVTPPSNELLASYDNGAVSDIQYYTGASTKWLPDFGQYTGANLSYSIEANDLCLAYNNVFMIFSYDCTDADMERYIELLKSLGFIYIEQPYEVLDLKKGTPMLYKDGNYVVIENHTIATYPGISPMEAIVETSNLNSSSDEISVYISGNKVKSDRKPLLIDNSTMIPLRAIFEALGAEVSWDGETQTITAVRGTTTITLVVGNNEMTVNGKTVTINMPPILIGSYTYVPVRAVSEAFDCNVDWDGGTKKVTITETASTATPKPTKTPKPTATPKPTTKPKATKAPKSTTIPKSQDEGILILYTDSNIAYKNSEKQYIDADNLKVMPVVIDGRTLVPVRYISEAFGGTVDWDSDTQKVTIKIGEDEIKLFVNKNYILINGIAHDLDIPAQIIDGRTMIPLRAIAEAIGKSVEYYNGLILIGSKIAVADMMKSDLDNYIANNYKPDDNISNNNTGYNGAQEALDAYALANIKYIYDEKAKKGNEVLTDIRFMLADVSRDGIPELIAVGVRDNEMRAFEIYRFEDGVVSKIFEGSLIYVQGGAHHITRYNGEVCIGGESSRSGNGWTDWLGTYDGNDWIEVYESHVDIDHTTSDIHGYIVNGEYVSETEFDRIRKEIRDNDLTLADFTHVPSE